MVATGYSISAGFNALATTLQDELNRSNEHTNTVSRLFNNTASPQVADNNMTTVQKFNQQAYSQNNGYRNDAAVNVAKTQRSAENNSGGDLQANKSQAATAEKSIENTQNQLRENMNDAKADAVGEMKVAGEREGVSGATIDRSISSSSMGVVSAVVDMAVPTQAIQIAQAIADLSRGSRTIGSKQLARIADRAASQISAKSPSGPRELADAGVAQPRAPQVTGKEVEHLIADNWKNDREMQELERGRQAARETERNLADNQEDMQRGRQRDMDLEARAAELKDANIAFADTQLEEQKVLEGEKQAQIKEIQERVMEEQHFVNFEMSGLAVDEEELATLDQEGKLSQMARSFDNEDGLVQLAKPNSTVSVGVDFAQTA